MKSRTRDIMSLMATALSLALFASFWVGAEARADMSAKDKDGFILYKYSLLDARRDDSPKISESTEGNKITYKYDGHALSCRTVMTGSITKTTLEDRTHVVGDFQVGNNSYGITQLSLDFYDEGSKRRTGTITVDDKVIDISRFDRR